MTQWNIKNFYRFSFDIFNPRTAALNEDFDNIEILEFPLMQWLIAIVHRLFGNSDDILITRASLFILSIVSIIGIYQLIKEIHQDSMVSSVTAVSFLFAPMFYYYSINPIPDNFALCMSIWFLVYILKYSRLGETKYLLYSAIFISLSILAKLPFIIFGGAAFILVLKSFVRKDYSELRTIIVCFTISLIPPIIWYSMAIKNWQRDHLLTGILGDSLSISEAISIIRFHLFETLPMGILGPVSVVFFVIGILAIIKNVRFIKWKTLTVLLPLLLAIIYVIYELKYIGKVHDYYLLPFLPYAFIIVSYGIKLIKQRFLYILVMLMILIPITTYMSTNDHWTVEKTYFNPNLFMYKEDLKNAVPKNHPSIFLNDGSYVIFSYQMDQWGYMFDKNHLPAEWIDHMIKHGGVQYMYSDSRIVDQSPKVQVLIDKELIQRGNIKVFKLKKM